MSLDQNSAGEQTDTTLVKPSQAFNEIPLPSEFVEERQFTIGKTTFYITKLQCMEGLDVLEDIRVAMGAANVAINQEVLKNADSAGAMIVNLFLKVPKRDVAVIQSKLFTSVSFTRKGNIASAIPLHGSEDMAFDGLEPADVYQVLVRALLVNFTKSLTGMMSLMDETQSSPQPDTET